MEISPAQCRAARALIDMTQLQLADASGVSIRTIVHLEKGSRTLVPANFAALKRALEEAGVVFIFEGTQGVGVRLRSEKLDEPERKGLIDRIFGAGRGMPPR